MIVKVVNRINLECDYYQHVSVSKRELDSEELLYAWFICDNKTGEIFSKYDTRYFYTQCYSVDFGWVNL